MNTETPKTENYTCAPRRGPRRHAPTIECASPESWTTQDEINFARCIGEYGACGIGNAELVRRYKAALLKRDPRKTRFDVKAVVAAMDGDNTSRHLDDKLPF